MNNKQKLTRKIIEAIPEIAFKCKDEFVLNENITFSHILKAILNKGYNKILYLGTANTDEILSQWKLVTKDGKVATLDDQTNDIIKKLLKLFN